MNTSAELMTALVGAAGAAWLATRLARTRRVPIAQAVLGTALPDEVSFPSRDGRARVQASLLAAPQAEAAVVLVVGQVGCWGSDARVEGRNLHVRTMAQALRARGLTVLVTRLRGHGESERHDVLGAVDYLMSHGFRSGRIGVIGASIGAAAALLAAAEEPAVAAVVADSPRMQLRAMDRRPAGRLLPLARWAGRVLSGLDLGRRPLLGDLTSLRNRAVLVVHGRGDRIVPPAMAQDVAKASGARLWLTASQSHAGTLHEALPLYITRVVDFFCLQLQQRAEPLLAPASAEVWEHAAA